MKELSLPVERKYVYVRFKEDRVMNRRLYLAMVLVSLVCLICLVSASAMAVPGVINYQGKLTNTSDCVLTGDYPIHFSLYYSETGGTASWGEEQNVSVDQGIFSVQLGKVTPFPAGLFDGDNLYLEMSVQNPDTGLWEPLSPRQRLTSTAYAIKSDTSNYATLAGSVQDGSITPDKIADGAIDSAKIKDHTIQQQDLGFSPFPVDGHSLDAADGDPVDAVYVDNEGKVGIGTTNPENALTVTGMVMGTPTIEGVHIGLWSGESAQIQLFGTHPLVGGVIDFSHSSGTDADWRIMSNSNNLQIGAGTGAAGIAFSKNGNVGIGTTSPSERLQVAGAVQTNRLIVSNPNPTDDTTINIQSSGHGGGITNEGSDGNMVFVIDGSSGFVFRNYYGEKVRITGDGNVGIATTSPSYTLHVNGSAGKPGGGSWSNASDERLKKEIKPLTGALDKLIQLQGVNFEWVNPEEHGNQSGTQAGLVAQEVEKVFPEWVSEIDPAGKDKEQVAEGEKIKSLYFPHGFNAYLVEAIKELRAQNEALKSLVCQDHPEAQVCQ